MHNAFWVGLIAGAISCAGSAIAQSDGAHDIRAPDAPMGEITLRLPAEPSEEISREIVLYHPPGNKRFPLAILIHGPIDESANPGVMSYRFSFAADFFLSRGYAVALVPARWIGDQTAGGGGRSCDLSTAVMKDARAIASIISTIAFRPEIEADGIVVAGQTAGSLTALAIGTIAVPGVRAVVAFSPPERSACDNQIALFTERLGQSIPFRTQWFYSANAKLNPLETWDEAYDAFYKADQVKSHEHLLVTSNGPDFTQFPEGRQYWVPSLSYYLSTAGLPNEETNPDYLPSTWPEKTTFADLDDVDAVSFLDAKGRETYKDFLSKPGPRAFSITNDHRWLVTVGGFDPVARAQAICRKSGITCRPYAIDGHIVWAGGDP